jgi:hypothetical protein
VLPSISLYKSNNSLSLFPNLSANKQYFSETITPAYPKLGFIHVPTVPPFRWSQPHLPSFIETQEKAAKQRSDEKVGFLQDIVGYQAHDAIEFDMTHKTASIRGAGSIKYEKSQLTADNIAFNWNTNTVIATGKVNEEGKIDPKPVFEDGDAKYIAEEIRYNLQSQRGKARKLFTKKEEALIRANQAKVDVESTYYADDLDFTTCNLAKPHYTVKIRRLKFVQDKRIASGPFQFYFDGVPTPLGFFYGLFYLPAPKASGIIRPQLGEDATKGFFLRDGGYYFYFNDYIDLALKGSIYSKGHSDFQGESNYIKRYAFKGKLSYKREILSHTTETALQEDKEKEWQFKWNHETTNNKVSSLTAEVDIRSKSPRSSQLVTAYDPNKLNAQTHSKVRYTRRFIGTPYSMNASIAHNTDFSKKPSVTVMTLPQFSVGTSPIYLFRWGSAVPQHWYEDIYIQHTSDFQNEITNQIGNQDPIDFSWKNRKQLFEEGRYGFKHTFPIKTNIKLFSYFNLSPSFNYTERWYFKRRDYKDGTAFDTTPGFYRVWDYDIRADLQTTIYGTHLFGEEAAVQGIRHRIEPAIGFVYTPDFSKDSYGYFQKIQTKQGEKKCNRFEHAIYGTPKEKESAELTVKVDNVLEMKMKDASSSVSKSKKIPILESLSISTGYDFLEENFPLRDIDLRARTRLFDNLISLEYSATYDPYFYHNRQRIAEYAWQHGQGLGNMTKYAFKISTTLQSKHSDTRPDNAPGKKVDAKGLLGSSQGIGSPAVAVDPTKYVEFDVPWQLTLGYQQNYTYQIKEDVKKTIRQITMDGDFKISQNWKITFHTTYDVDKKELVGSDTRIGIDRDLHCWQMTFNWIPLAKKQSYEFSIGLKASMLQDLKFPHNREYEKL